MSERKVWVTKYALTEGVRCCPADHFSECGKYAYVKWGQGWFNVQCGPSEWHDTLDGAQARVKEMAVAKLNSLDKQRAKLERLMREGAKVVDDQG